MCSLARSGSNPGPLGSEPSALTKFACQCASGPLNNAHNSQQVYSWNSGYCLCQLDDLNLHGSIQDNVLVSLDMKIVLKLRGVWCSLLEPIYQHHDLPEL